MMEKAQRLADRLCHADNNCWLRQDTTDRGKKCVQLTLVNDNRSDTDIYITAVYSVFCPGFQKGRVPSEKGTFSAVNGPSKGHH